MAYYEIPVTSSPDQVLTVNMAGTQAEIRLAFNTRSERWSLDLSIDGVQKLYGQRVVTGVDLIAPAKLGSGSIYLIKWLETAGDPGLKELPAGDYRLIYVSNEGV